MPPQQGDGLLYIGGGAFDLGAHSILGVVARECGPLGSTNFLRQAGFSQIVGNGFFVNRTARIRGHDSFAQSKIRSN
jgi:hypothetical protein